MAKSPAGKKRMRIADQEAGGSGSRKKTVTPAQRKERWAKKKNEKQTEDERAADAARSGAGSRCNTYPQSITCIDFRRMRFTCAAASRKPFSTAGANGNDVLPLLGEALRKHRKHNSTTDDTMISHAHNMHARIVLRMRACTRTCGRHATQAGIGTLTRNLWRREARRQSRMRMPALAG